ncbi:Calcineurin-like phosphoesterase superfamily domain-containing protein [Halovenus aranensis]|uniref:Calcineurin-like phosphoesterase superfamily domain-containing protein n=1 Tax=Halovenus aranensis TaxID=890420 RepID=A0A1G8U9P5_9EURY|nr:metallophosphoesterase [Halovenus aranensis]SDJ50482.1 Calcineurin-like phosphoesterase superfamily domain-containing protein [Halovenus aranensis]
MTTVAILTDVHMREEYRSAVTETLKTIRVRLEQEEPAHVFVLGDIIQDSDDAATDRNHVARVADLLDGLPVTYLLGNHDTVSLSREDIGEILGQTEFRGRLDTGETPFVYLDTQRPDHRVIGNVGTEQREWLTKALEPGAVVLLHHPAGPAPIADNHWFWDAPARAFLSDQQAVLDVLCPDARATVNGHIHQTSAVQHRGVPHLSVNAVSKEHPDRPVTGTWALLDLDGPLTADLFVRDSHQQTISLE